MICNGYAWQLPLSGLCSTRSAMRRGVMTDWPAYFRGLVKPVEVERVRPAPEASSRAPWPDGVLAPGPVLKLAEEAREAGWEVALAYSRGFGAYRVRQWQREEMISVRISGHPLTERRCFAIYRRTAGAKPGAWAWSQVYLWGPDLFPFGLCNITELRDFIQKAGLVNTLWLGKVRRRVREAEQRAAQAAENRPKKASGKKAEQGG